MRSLNEIQQDIQNLMPDFDAISSKMSALNKEMHERLFSDFCDKYGVKAGDIITIGDGDEFQIVKLQPLMHDYIVVRTFEEDGTPCKHTCVLHQNLFEGCKVVGHMDLENNIYWKNENKHKEAFT